MFERFQLAVRDAYLDLDNDKLGFNKLAPSTGSLKKWCIYIYANGLSTEDKKVFDKFFHNYKQESDLGNLIARFDPDKFRPLRNFIINNTKRPDENTVKLLAVLIDFKKRPYCSRNWSIENYIEPFTEPEQLDTIDFIEKGPKPMYHEFQDLAGSAYNWKIPRYKPPSHPLNYEKHFLSGTIILFITCVIILFCLTKKQCMCWVEVQYIQVDCTLKSPKCYSIPLNNYQLRNFKKINRPDTLTVKDVNTVWFSNINNELEFFTESGIHPIHRDNTLKVMSAHILSKYMIRKTQTRLTE